MGTCKYCGKSTGIFLTKHDECESKHNEGLKAFTRVIDEYFESKVAFSSLKTTMDYLRINYFVTEEDIISITQAYLQRLSRSMKRQNSVNIYQHLKEFLNGVELRYYSLNSNRILDSFGERFIRYHLVSYFATGVPIQKVKQTAERTAREFHLRPDQIEQTHFEILDKAAYNYLKSKFLYDSEQLKVNEYVSTFRVPLNHIPKEYQNTPAEKRVQAAILKDLHEGLSIHSLYQSQSYCPKMSLRYGFTIALVITKKRQKRSLFGPQWL